MDLVEEEDRRASAATEPLPRAFDHRPYLGSSGLDRALFLERGLRRARNDPRERRLAAARRPVQDHRVGPPLLDRPPERRARRQQPLLTDELVEGPRPHPGRERRVRRQLLALIRLGL